MRARGDRRPSFAVLLGVFNSTIMPAECATFGYSRDAQSGPKRILNRTFLFSTAKPQDHHY